MCVCVWGEVGDVRCWLGDLVVVVVVFESSYTFKSFSLAVFSQVVKNSEAKERRTGRTSERESTRRTRRLKIEAQRRLGLKIAGDALRTPETRTHGLKPKRRRWWYWYWYWWLVLVKEE